MFLYYFGKKKESSLADKDNLFAVSQQKKKRNENMPTSSTQSSKGLPRDRDSFEVYTIFLLYYVSLIDTNSSNSTTSRDRTSIHYFNLFIRKKI